MEILSVFDKEFAEYGRVVDGFDYTELLKVLEDTTPMPDDAVVYVPGDAGLEATAVYTDLMNNVYGGMPIQIGYCNGNNTKLNCLEYHRDSEINIPSRDAILLLARMADIVDGKLDTASVKAFKVPAGVAVEVYATTLHYAPCNAKAGCGFRVIIVLPKGTNLELPKFEVKNVQDGWMTAANKWLLAHAESDEAQNGAYVGLTGVNIDIAADI